MCLDGLIKNNLSYLAHIGKPLSVQHMTPQQIQNIPPLMSTPVNPVNINMLPQSKNQYDQRINNRQNKLAPRLVYYYSHALYRCADHAIFLRKWELGRNV